MRLGRLVAMGLIGFSWLKVNAQSPWEQPTAALADQIAEILGPAQTHITIRNLSTVPADQIPAIRDLVEQDLKSHGVSGSDAQSANTIRITLSEDTRELLWVAEVVEGNETRVAMVRSALESPKPSQPAGGMTLRRQAILNAHEPVLALLETADGLVSLEQEQIVIYARTPNGWEEQKRVNIGQRRLLARDPRGILLMPANGDGFEALLPGTKCAGNYTPAQPQRELHVQCGVSDDPWPIVQINGTDGPALVKAFYNAARNNFTGVVAPSVTLDLPPFYAAVQLPRPNGAGLLIGGIDGKVQLLETASLKTVTGTRDWGSDFAPLHSGCGAGTQIVASGSGEAVSDSLRAYELPALEAVPTSPPLAVDGTVMALWPAPDGKSVFAVIRSKPNEYEVDRVTANCN